MATPPFLHADKLSPKWMGPFVVTKVPNRFQVEYDYHGETRRAHVNLTKRYYADDERGASSQSSDEEPPGQGSAALGRGTILLPELQDEVAPQNDDVGGRQRNGVPTPRDTSRRQRNEETAPGDAIGGQRNEVPAPADDGGTTEPQKAETKEGTKQQPGREAADDATKKRG